jgi:simple sugar transport system ATP-binding protein
MTAEWLIEVDDCIKRYGGVTALKSVSLRVRAGSVHGLLGENGAGKSTLVKVIAGITQATSGTLRFNGEDVVDADVQTMEEKGVFLVTQEPMIVGSMTVADNLMLGRWPSRSGFVRDRHMMALATSFLEEAHLDPRRLASTLSAVEKRKLNILRALHSGGKLIILDEPTTALTMTDKQQLFTFMKRLRAQSVSFLFISHYNEEILEICDEVSVLRDGQMIGQGQTVSHLDSTALSEMVIGRDVHLFHRQTSAERGDVAWCLRDIRARGLRVDRLELRRGEIMGFAGLPGSGAKELGRAIYGLTPSAKGYLDEDGVAHALPRDPAEALRTGIAFLSEDRLRDGIIAIQSIAENMSLSSLPSVSRFGWVSQLKERELVEKFWRLFAVKAPSHAAPLGSLSGGNQQKVLLSRLVATNPSLVILNEVKEEVHRLVDDLSHRGVSVIIITSDIEEMLRVVDRVALFVDGEISSIEPANGLTKEDVFDMAYSTAGRTLSTTDHHPH